MTLSAADRLDILDVVSRADAAATRRDADAYVSLFTDDAVLDGSQGRHAGKAGMRSSVGPIWAAEGPATLHLTLNPVIDAGNSQDEANRQLSPADCRAGRDDHHPHCRGHYPDPAPGRRPLAHQQANRRRIEPSRIVTGRPHP